MKYLMLLLLPLTVLAGDSLRFKLLGGAEGFSSSKTSRAGFQVEYKFAGNGGIRYGIGGSLIQFKRSRSFGDRGELTFRSLEIYGLANYSFYDSGNNSFEFQAMIPIGAGKGDYQERISVTERSGNFKYVGLYGGAYYKRKLSESSIGVGLEFGKINYLSSTSSLKSSESEVNDSQASLILFYEF